MTPEELVALAKAGASGVCIVAVVYLTHLLRTLSNNASLAKHHTIRFYIVVVFLMTIVLAVSSWNSNLTTQNSKLTSQLEASKADNLKYRDAMTSIGTVYEKVHTEFDNATSSGHPTLREFMKLLDKTMNDAAKDHLIKQWPLY